MSLEPYYPPTGGTKPPNNSGGSGGTGIPGLGGGFSGSSSATATSDPYYNTGGTSGGGGLRGVVNNFALDGSRVDSAIGSAGGIWLWLAVGAVALGGLWWYFKKYRS